MAISGGARVGIFGRPGHVDRVAVTTPWGIDVQCHRILVPRFLDACDAASAILWKPQRIDSFNPRPVRGEDGSDIDEWSIHSWALAWDFFATPPGVAPPGGVWTPDNPVPLEFAACFIERGFRWGATFDRVDLPHIEWAEGWPAAVPPKQAPAPPAVSLPTSAQEGAVAIMFRPPKAPGGETAADDFWIDSATGTVRHRWYEGGQWFPIDAEDENLGGHGTEVAAAWRADGAQLRVVVTGDAGKRYEKVYDAVANAWSGFVPLPGVVLVP